MTELDLDASEDEYIRALGRTVTGGGASLHKKTIWRFVPIRTRDGVVHHPLRLQALHAHVRAARPGSPPPPDHRRRRTVLLYVHGTSSSALDFASSMCRLAPLLQAAGGTRRDLSVEVHALDLPGFGRSGGGADLAHDLSHSDPPRVAEFYADVVRAYVEYLDTETETRLVLMGHSFGGFVATQYAARYRGAGLAGLVLVNCAGLFPVMSRWGCLWALFFKACLPQALLRAVGCTIGTERTLRLLERRVLPSVTSDDDGGGTSSSSSSVLFWRYYFRLLMSPCSFAHRLIGRFVDVGATRCKWAYPILNDLLRLLSSLPSLSICFIHGEHDTISPPHQGETAARCLNELRPAFPSSCAVIEGAGHAPFCDKEAEFCEQVVEFVDGILSSSPSCSETRHAPSPPPDVIGALAPHHGRLFSLDGTEREMTRQYASAFECCAKHAHFCRCRQKDR